MDSTTISLPSSTLLQLPIELLIEISLQSGNHSSLLLVCKHLYHIICSTPSFWGSIFIGKGQCVDNGETYLTKYLERGRICSLDVTVQSAEPTLTVELELWHILTAHRARIRAFSLWTDKISLCARILHTILIAQGPSALPFLHKLQIEFDYNVDFEGTYHPISDPMSPQRLLRPTASLFPSLTTLFLPFVSSYIPYLASPLHSLKTLVLYGPIYFVDKIKPSKYQISHLLSHIPELETLWCKTQSMFGGVLDEVTHSPIGPGTQSLSARGILQSIELPILLHKLSRLAVAVPGDGTELLRVINAPQLQDLHLDGTRDDEELGDRVAWLLNFPEDLYTILKAASLRSRGLRRLTVIGVYLARSAWEELLGCGMASAPFPILESIAVRGIEAVRWQVHNEVDDELIELCARDGRLPLRRFVHVGCEPQLTARSIHQLVNSTLARRMRGDVFEIELDSRLGGDTRSRLDELLGLGIRATLHEDPPQVEDWWALDGGIDPTEASSY